MAGAGYKLFNTGDVLTAAQVNTYLNEQTVMVFASSAARTSALSGVLAEGMVSYLQDTNAVEVYNGTAWVGVSGAGDVTEVQAGTGISVASGTGPIPVVTNTMATAVDAKGDLVAGTGADTFARLAVGTNGQVLTADSTAATGLAWATAASGGMTLLSTISLSGSSTTYNSITTGYKYLKLVGVNLQNSTTAQDMDIKINNLTTGVYVAGVTGATANQRANYTIPISSGSGVKNATNLTFVCDIYNYDSSTVEKVIHLDGLLTADYLTTIQPYTFGGVFKSTTAITSLVFVVSSGTMSGTVYAYGVN
jgi:hypothetical protein